MSLGAACLQHVAISLYFGPFLLEYVSFHLMATLRTCEGLIALPDAPLGVVSRPAFALDSGRGFQAFKYSQAPTPMQIDIFSSHLSTEWRHTDWSPTFISMADERYMGRSRRLQSHDERAPRPRPSAWPETHRDEDGVDDALYAAYTSTQSFDGEAVPHADATITPLRHPMTPRIRRLHATLGPPEACAGILRRLMRKCSGFLRPPEPPEACAGSLGRWVRQASSGDATSRYRCPQGAGSLLRASGQVLGVIESFPATPKPPEACAGSLG
ncbi:hypothetical protein FB107DRAFT_252784 [Schizophyllum commune]